MLSTSQDTQDAIKSCEGLRLAAYDDGTGKITIGYGHTRTATPGAAITKKQAEKLFDIDLALAEKDVHRLIKTDLTQNQFDALVMFVFNLGGGAKVAKSQLFKAINNRDFERVPRLWMQWVYALNKQTGKKEPWPGLVKRRRAELGIWRGLSDDDTSAPGSAVAEPAGDLDILKTLKASGTLKAAIAGIAALAMQLFDGLKALSREAVALIDGWSQDLSPAASLLKMIGLNLPEFGGGAAIAALAYVIWRRFRAEAKGKVA